ncbi:hypothetical protein [Nocardioides sp. cx-173]|uniref:hypothetical protein n=1 Tax=Nocardioides sp. cx-173 TaxID=2898796 RepID=UPI001E611349|nr:hypothetical protein [Nocardioides sp. cx-173]MCD4526906.1 hypothetical protein [Nocardioides sp. cx-173]UGB41306.1 hypothetical protein LQ940_18285 [Nocardioides sp. cx-173]
MPEKTLRDGLVRPVRRDLRGLTGPTPAQTRGPRWRRTSRGFYVPSHVTDDLPEQRILEASAVAPPGLGVTGWAALRWCGARWFDGTAADGSRRPVTIAVSTHDIRPQPGIAVTGEGAPPRLVTTVDGVCVTRPVWSTSFEMRYAGSERAAVVVLDMAAYADLVSFSEMQDFLGTQSAWTGIPQARAASALAVENSWSPQESWMRLAWQLDAGLPPPLCNVPIFDLHGRHLVTPDLFDPEAGLVGEYDGHLHLEPGQRRRDIRRGERCHEHDLEVVVAVSGDLRPGDSFVSRLLAARRRARRRQPARRTWTLEQPSWWVPTETVAQRRRLTDEERRVWLARRRA